MARTDDGLLAVAANVQRRRRSHVDGGGTDLEQRRSGSRGLLGHSLRMDALSRCPPAEFGRLGSAQRGIDLQAARSGKFRAGIVKIAGKVAWVVVLLLRRAPVA